LGCLLFPLWGCSQLNLLAGSNSGHRDSMNFIIFFNISTVESIENQRQLQVPKTGTTKQAQKITTRRNTLENRELEGRTPSGSKLMSVPNKIRPIGTYQTDLDHY